MTMPSPRLTFSDPFVCPGCSARLPVEVVTCPSCGILLAGPLATELLATLRAADGLLVRLRAASPTGAAAASASATVSAPLPDPEPVPVPRRTTRPALSAMSVPKILLGLGALCLLVAAVIFLAVAWSWLGVGGRTAVLAALTVLSAVVGIGLCRRGLRVAAEALTTVGLGLLALDVVGADNAGWLGDLDVAGLTCVVGGTVLAAALALALATGLAAPQVAAGLALSALGLGATARSEHVTTAVVLVVLGYAALAAAGRRRGLLILQVAAACGGGLWWLALALLGLDDALGGPSVRGLWVEGLGAGLLVASLLLLVPVPFVRTHALVVRMFAAASAALLTVTLCLPAVDESATVLGVVALAALVCWTLVAVAVPVGWRTVPRVPLLLAAVPVTALTGGLAVQAAVNAVGVASPFTQAAGVRLSAVDAVAAPLLLVLGAAGLLGAALSFAPRPTAAPPQALAGVVGAAAIGTLALHPVPAWVVAATLVLLGTGLLADGWRRGGASGRGQALAGVGVAVAAVPVALPSDVLTTVVVSVVVAMAATLAWRGRASELRVVGGVLLPLSLAGWVWSSASVLGVDPADRGVPVLLVTGLLAIAVPRVEIELATAVAGVAAASAAIAVAADPSVSLAVQLTVAGVLVCGSALVHPGRRMLGWVGGALLAAATWVRLADVGVTAPEPYTLPSAVALLLVGMHRLWRDPEASTTAALAPGLLLATVPSLLWVLLDPVSWRAVLLGAACLLLVLLGTTLRWSAPLVIGAGVGCAIVLRELAPYAVQTPQWVLIGAAGALLTVVGISWEHRMRDLRAASAYVAHLR